ncbi:hypothetical protein [Ideonella sp. BN130291]|uniref:hypothetical protein n=1 Tax=Ideonella sp. BN130291 TaxID=3112940 RepID=UPI002E2691C5|nr:hypothetical protein [Ideonella sp. BN130291]
MNGTVTWLGSFVALVALLLGAAIAFVVTRGIYDARLRRAQERLAQGAKLRMQTTELLLQARRQVELLGKELEAARRLRAPARATTAGVPPAAPSLVSPPVRPEVAAVNAILAEATRPPAPPGGFADTLPCELRPAPPR